ncbi:MAG: hypothetical protein ABIU77_05805 [Ferruginibacter sp.]
MKKNSILMVLVFTLLSGRTVQAQSSQTGVKKVIADHSEQTDKLQGKKIQQGTLSGNTIEKVDAAVVEKPKANQKIATKSKKIVTKKKKVKKH